MKFFTYLSAILVFIVMLFSCSAKQEIVLDLSGEGEGAMEIELHPVLTDYLTDLAMVVSDAGDPEDLPVFDEVGIWNAFAGNDSVELISVEIPEREKLIIHWRFTDLNDPFIEYPEDEKKVLFFGRDGAARIFEFSLSPGNFHQVSRYFPLVDEELLAYFGPNPEDPVPEDIYKEDLEFALEDYLGDLSIEEVLERSRISILVKPGGRIISSVGAVRKGDAVLFEVPLIKYLTLNEPLGFRLVFSSGG